jgi:uncharacterized RDD family membrane protein YckC
MSYQSPPQGGYPPPPPGNYPQQPGAFPPQQPAPYQGGYAGGPTYAGFWIRFAARIVDTFIVGIPLVIVFFILASAAGGLAAGTSNGSQSQQNAAAAAFGGIFILFYLIALVLSIAYWVYFWGTTGSTFGMRLFHLRVVDANTGGPIGIGRAIVRWLMTIVNSWACYIGWIWVAFDSRKQGWHDKVANSVVLQGQ